MSSRLRHAFAPSVEDDDILTNSSGTPPPPRSRSHSHTPRYTTERAPLTDFGVEDRPRFVNTHQLIAKLLSNPNTTSLPTHSIDSALLLISSRLDSETARATAAEQRGASLLARLKTSEAALAQARAESTKLSEELRLYQGQLERAQAEILRAQRIVDEVQRQRDDAEEAAARARETARRIKEEWIIQNARDEGRKQGFEEGVRRARAVSGFLGQPNPVVEEEEDEDEDDEVIIPRPESRPRATSEISRPAAPPRPHPEPNFVHRPLRQTAPPPRPVFPAERSSGHHRSASVPVPPRTPDHAPMPTSAPFSTIATPPGVPPPAHEFPARPPTAPPRSSSAAGRPMPIPPPQRPPTAGARPPTAQSNRPILIMPEPVAQPQPQYPRSPGHSLPPVSERPTPDESDSEYDERDDRPFDGRPHVEEAQAPPETRRSVPTHFSPWEVVPTPLPPPDPFLAHQRRQTATQTRPQAAVPPPGIYSLTNQTAPAPPPPSILPPGQTFAAPVPPPPQMQYPYVQSIINPNAMITVQYARMSPPSQTISEIDLVSPPRPKPGLHTSESLRDVLGDARRYEQRKKAVDEGRRSPSGPRPRDYSLPPPPPAAPPPAFDQATPTPAPRRSDSRSSHRQSDVRPESRTGRVASGPPRPPTRSESRGSGRIARPDSQQAMRPIDWLLRRNRPKPPQQASTGTIPQIAVESPSESASSVDANTPPNIMNMLSPDHAHNPLPIFPNPDQVYQAAMNIANSPRGQYAPELSYDHDEDDEIAPPGRFRDTSYDDAPPRERHHRHTRESARYGTPDFSEHYDSSGYSTPTTRVSHVAERRPLGFVPVRTGEDYFTSALEQHPIHKPKPTETTAAHGQRQRPHVPPLDTTQQAFAPLEVEMSPNSSRSGSSRSPRYVEAPIPAGIQYPEPPISRGTTPTGRRRSGSNANVPTAEQSRRTRRASTTQGSGLGSRVIIADPANLVSPISLFNNQ